MTNPTSDEHERLKQAPERIWTVGGAGGHFYPTRRNFASVEYVRADLLDSQATVDEFESHRPGIIEAIQTAEARVDELEAENAALREQLAQHERQIALWFGPHTCSVCGGAPLASGRPCVCGGKGTMQAEFEGLRQELFNDDEVIAKLKSELAQTERERDEARSGMMRICTHPNTYPLKEATRRCHDCGLEIFL